MHKRWLVYCILSSLLNLWVYKYRLCVTLFYMKSIRVSTRDFHNFNYSSDVHVAYRHHFGNYWHIFRSSNCLALFSLPHYIHIYIIVLRKRTRFSFQIVTHGFGVDEWDTKYVHFLYSISFFLFGGRMAPHWYGIQFALTDNWNSCAVCSFWCAIFSYWISRCVPNSLMYRSNVCFAWPTIYTYTQMSRTPKSN